MSAYRFGKAGYRGRHEKIETGEEQEAFRKSVYSRGLINVLRTGRLVYRRDFKIIKILWGEHSGCACLVVPPLVARELWEVLRRYRKAEAEFSPCLG